MNITDMLFGHKRLKDMGFSDQAIREALSEKEFRTEHEVIQAVEQSQNRINKSRIEELERIVKRAILHGQEVDVPSWVATCPECGSPLAVRSNQWESATGIPDRVGLEQVCIKDDEESEGHAYRQYDWQPVMDRIAEFFDAK